MNNLVGDVKANPRELHRYNQSEKRYPRYSPVEKEEWNSTQSEFEKAEEFNGQFSDVFTTSEYKQVPLLDRSEIMFLKQGE